MDNRRTSTYFFLSFILKLFVSFHVVIPSLPGYFKSTLPQAANWDNRKVAPVFHHLMKDVLGYKTYVGQGGDWVRKYPLVPFRKFLAKLLILAGKFSSSFPRRLLSRVRQAVALQRLDRDASFF